MDSDIHSADCLCSDIECEATVSNNLRTMKVLYFDSILQESQNGGYIGLQRNLAMIEVVFGKENIHVCSLYNPTKLQGLRNFAFDKSFYHSKINDIKIESAIANGPYDLIFLNGPLVYKYLDCFLSSNPIVFLYCHNVDYEYAINKFKLSHSLSDLLFSRYVKRAESYVVKNASLISVLNSRDAKGLSKWYGREADLVLPIAMEKIPSELLSPDSDIEYPYGLFVGSSIGPNIEGLIWFFEHVAPSTPGVNYEIVGSCCDFFKDKEIPGNVKLRGRVDDLDSIYRNASFVICPIFSGSGMKTKTIEALRYGKTIIGTQEAFEGIDVDYGKVGLKSDMPEEHVKKINALDPDARINMWSLEEFNDKFTYEVVFEKFRNKIKEFSDDCKK